MCIMQLLNCKMNCEDSIYVNTDFSNARKSKMDAKYDFINLKFDSYLYEEGFKNDEGPADIPPMPPLEAGKKEVKKGT